MGQLGYVLRRIRSLHVDQMLNKVAELHRQTGKSRLFLFADMINCGFRYQAGYMDYALFAMHSLGREQRKTVLTRGINNLYVAKLNAKSSWPVFEKKNLFLKKFSPFIGREYLDLSDADFSAFVAFAKKHSLFIAKPPDGTHGDGVEKIDCTDENIYPALYERLRANGQTLLEEVVVQHPDLAAIYPGSVNTIRVVSLVRGGKSHIVFAYFRIGNGGKHVDNFNNGGMVVPVDVTTGVIRAPAVDKVGHIFAAHPATGAPIEGAAIPLWQACRDLVAAASLVISDVRYVGWDVAVTPAGPVLIEGNHFPGHDIYQLPAHTPDKIGVLPELQAVYPLNELASH
ncbi:hypothetical protein LJC32_00100 [Oscillospiraceae bacterium OttesenSCG-928-F05]|nr:hypothetical protein [Oscillospiraceae bacterium OttesenSCG-928-F05]